MTIKGKLVQFLVPSTEAISPEKHSRSIQATENISFLRGNVLVVKRTFGNVIKWTAIEDSNVSSLSCSVSRFRPKKPPLLPKCLGGTQRPLFMQGIMCIYVYIIFIYLLKHI